MNNPSEFFIKCSQIIVDENKKDTLRQSTATVMKALLVKKVYFYIFRIIMEDFTGIGSNQIINLVLNKHY